MKNKLNKFTAGAAGMLLLASGIALPLSNVFAATSLSAAVNTATNAAIGTPGITTNGGVNASANANHNANVGINAGANVDATVTVIARITAKANQEITRRITALDSLSARVNAMAKISASDKSFLSSSVQSQITAMNNLQAKIASDASADSTSSLKADIQSITKSYRIFALIIPQGAIEAASDRVLNVSGLLAAVAGQLQARITAAQSAGTNMGASVSVLADMNAKIADANTQANAATNETANLKADNGDQTVMAANTAALKDARAKIQAAQKDLVTARADAGTIAKALFSMKASASGTTTVSTTP